MTTRTFKQKAQGYGSGTVSIVATLDGTTIYSGTVNTLNTPVPALPDANVSIDNDAFSWTKDVAFEGTSTLNITVSGGTLLLADTLANYGTEVFDSPPPGLAPLGAGTDSAFYYVDQDGTNYAEPLSSVTINGQSVSRPWNDLTGQYYHTLRDGDVFSATVNVSKGYEITAYDAGVQYKGLCFVTSGGTTYGTTQDVTPAGTAVTDTNYWKDLS